MSKLVEVKVTKSEKRAFDTSTSKIFYTSTNKLIFIETP
jgi:hypothetical protein